VVVELDSWEYHGTRAAFERDRRRDRILVAAGWRPLRVTWRDLDEPGALEGELRAVGV
jgi:very-short-patch-repair endonuclease